VTRWVYQNWQSVFASIWVLWVTCSCVRSNRLLAKAEALVKEAKETARKAYPLVR
jgi:hypothetical protein